MCSSPLRSLRSAAAAALVALVTVLGLVSCFGDGAGPMPLALEGDCASRYRAGSAPVPIAGRLTRGGAPVQGATMVFRATAGVVLPDQVLTDGDGRATAMFTPPASAGSVRIDLQVTDPRHGDVAATSCVREVVAPLTGQAVVTLATSHSGPLAGLQVLLQYPPNLDLVEPVAFTGFATDWLTAVNTTDPGEVSIGGIAQPGTSVAGGEFLRVTFVWAGSPPARQLFRIGELQASDDASQPIADFAVSMDVLISP